MLPPALFTVEHLRRDPRARRSVLPTIQPGGMLAPRATVGGSADQAALPTAARPPPPAPQLPAAVVTAAPQPPAGSATAIPDDVNDGTMCGVDEVDLVTQPMPEVNAAERLAAAASDANAVPNVMAGRVLIASAGRTDRPLRDYDPFWFAMMHPNVFPNGTGTCPSGLSLKAWIQCLTQRFSPMAEPPADFLRAHKDRVTQSLQRRSAALAASTARSAAARVAAGAPIATASASTAECAAPALHPHRTASPRPDSPPAIHAEPDSASEAGEDNRASADPDDDEGEAGAGGSDAADAAKAFRQQLRRHPASWPPVPARLPRPDRNDLREVRQDPCFLMDAMDTCSRHTVNRLSYVRARMSPHAASQIGDLTTEQLCEAVAMLAKRLEGEPQNRELQRHPPGVQQLFSMFQFTAPQAPGSPYATRILRDNQRGTELMLGPCSFFITFCPAPSNAQLVFHLAGRTYDFDLAPDTEGDPLNRPAAEDRWRLIARAPLAAAEFFRIFACSFCIVFLGWPPDSPQQKDAACPLGRVLAWFFNAETSQAGDLHAHGCVWVLRLRLEVLEGALAAGDPRAASVARFVEGLMFQWIPAPYQYVPDNRPTFRVELDDPTAADTEEIHPTPLNRTRAATCRPPLGPSAAQRRRRLTLAGRAVVELCRHEHTFTCFTGACRQHRCRLTLPRRLWERTHVLGTIGALVLKRRGQRLSAYNRALMYAQPCNQSWSCPFEVSRRLQEIDEWRAAHPAAPPDDPNCPALDPMPVIAATNARYATTYATKLEGHNQSVPLAHQVAIMQDREARRTHAPGAVPLADERQDLGRFRLAHTTNKMIGSYTRASQQVALQAQMGGSSLESHQFVSHDTRVFTALLTSLAGDAAAAAPGPSAAAAPEPLPPAARPAAVTAAAEATAVVEEGIEFTPEFASVPSADPANHGTRLTIVSKATDFLYRGAALELYSAILVTMWFQKVRLRI
jgi:hypothetical protein